MRPDPLLFLAALAGFLAVALGAFGAHALGPHLDERARQIYETAAHYQIVHALAAALAAALGDLKADPRFRNAGGYFLMGIVFFSGSLYALALTKISVLGAVTPVGGFLFLAGWARMGIAAISAPKRG